MGAGIKEHSRNNAAVCLLSLDNTMASRKLKARFKFPGMEGRVSRRPARVADLIRNEIATLLLLTIQDPGLNEVNVVSVSVTNDLKQARIFYSCRDELAKKAAKGLERAKGYIRCHLAKKLQLRVVPELEFKRDLSAKRQEEMERLFREIADESGS